MSVNTVFLLAPHPDDIEFSCGGSVVRWVSEGKKVFYIVFSPCNKSLPQGYEQDAIYGELNNSLKELCIPEEQCIKFRYPVREFPQYRQQILEGLIKLRKDHQPDLVVLPNSQDVHQDHHTIYEEGVRAFKHCKLLGYELPWNSLQFTSNFHVKLEADQLKKKFSAISCYKSQANRPYYDEQFFEGLARMRGTQINTNFAEAFELIRWWE